MIHFSRRKGDYTMKKLTTLIALLIVTITLASCTSEPESFKLNNYTISRITTVFEERNQYDSKFNIDAENNTVFGEFIEYVGEYDFLFLEDDTEVCDLLDPVTISVETNYGILIYSSSCIVIEDVDTEVTFVEFEDGVIAHTDNELFEKLIAIFE